MSAETKTRINLKTRDMALCSVFVVLIILGTYIKIPTLIPITFQFFFTTLAGSLLGAKNGARSVAVWMILGLIGLPVFTRGGGIGYVLQPSFGYIVGFIVGAYVTGKIIEKQEKLTYWNVMLADFAGLFTVYFIGLVYFYILSNYVINTPIAFRPLIVSGFLMTVPSDILATVVAAKLTTMLRPHIEKFTAD